MANQGTKPTNAETRDGEGAKPSNAETESHSNRTEIYRSM